MKRILTAVLLLGSYAWGTTTGEVSASYLANQCQNASSPDFTSSANPANAWCRGYMSGWYRGVQDTLTYNDKGVLSTVTFEEGVAGAQIAKVFVIYMANHPEEENKPSHVALMHAMLDDGLVSLPAATPASAPEETAAMSVGSTPDGAEIYVDGTFVGSTFANLKLAAGKHTIRVAQTGYKDWTKEIAVQAGSESHIAAKLEKK
jgi:PEGA domain-containing protein/Ssp1 endopeptidase immunity protein Rap1a